MVPLPISFMFRSVRVTFLTCVRGYLCHHPLFVLYLSLCVAGLLRVIQSSQILGHVPPA